MTSTGPWVRTDTIRRIGARSVEFKEASLTAGFKSPKNVESGQEKTANHALCEIRFSVKGKDIGQSGDLAEETIKVQSSFSAYSGLVPTSGW